MIATATAAPITRQIGNEEYQFGKFTLSDFGKLEQAIRDRITVTAIRLAATTEDVATKRMILDDARKDCKAANLMDTDYMERALSDFTNLIGLLKISLSHCHTDVTTELAERIFDGLDNETRNTLMTEILDNQTPEPDGATKKGVPI